MSTRNLDMARAAWGDAMPSWLETLATECDRTSQADVSRRLRYSGGVIGPVLRRSYTGSYDAVEQAMKGVFQAAKVRCPVLGDMAMQDCLEHQRRPFAGTNNIRVRLYKACRGGCTHSRLKTGGTAGKESL